MPDSIALWSALISGAVALAGIGHALVYKRDPRSATLWVLVIGMLPMLGTLLYLLFGINRYQRRARRWRSNVVHGATDSLGPTVPEPLQLLAALGRQATSLPLTSGNRIEPLVNGEQAYPAMLAAIRQASHSVALMSYIFDGQGIGEAFFSALVDAHRRGVQVRVLIDDVNVRLSRQSAYGALKRAGVPVAAFNATLIPARLHAVNLRNHRKILVVDGQTGFTGGTNISQPYWRPEAPEQAFRDLHFRIEGPVVAHLRDCFARDWCDTTGEALDREFWGEMPQLPISEGTWARGIEAGPDESIDRLRWIFMGALASARHSVRIWTPYFVPDQAIIAAIATAALRGVQIDILTPAQSDHAFVQWAAQAHYWQVLEHGARVHQRSGSFDHSKLVIVDEAWVCLGSANWDARSLRLNFEFNVEVYDEALSRRLADLFDHAKSQGVPVTRAQLARRPLVVKLRDGFARLFTPVL
ncbi:cardiolipin synthase [Rehaibacterium terrae]|jgi:cardiolipin synthase|uniref:Cardiolipin synthase n=1 Tax=Rehaibacterium terrae TaxID=1341696 RepID=A0A7W7Y248_9GAMM|nr:cardiolipin synthase [Rehaibacterium terrae]MBB5016600.1 cardiolipin synthase [Rehaibacterium terrae]